MKRSEMVEHIAKTLNLLNGDKWEDVKYELQIMDLQNAEMLLKSMEDLGMLPPSLVDKDNYRYGHIAWCKWSDE